MASEAEQFTDSLTAIRPGELHSRADLVADALRTALLSGRIGEDEMLVERKLAARLGVSKTPVREALIQLERNGLVTLIPNRGAMRRRMAPEDLRAIYEVRMRLEPWAIGRAAASGTVIHAGGQAILDEAAAAAARDDRAAESIANRRFHRFLYSQGDNAPAAAILDGLQDQVALGVVTLLWQEWPTWRAEATEHAAILAAVANGEAELAEELTAEHIQKSIDRLDAAFPA